MTTDRSFKSASHRQTIVIGLAVMALMLMLWLFSIVRSGRLVDIVALLFAGVLAGSLVWGAWRGGVHFRGSEVVLPFPKHEKRFSLGDIDGFEFRDSWSGRMRGVWVKLSDGTQLRPWGMPAGPKGSPSYQESVYLVQQLNDHLVHRLIPVPRFFGDHLLKQSVDIGRDVGTLGPKIRHGCFSMGK